MFSVRRVPWFNSPKVSQLSFWLLMVLGTYSSAAEAIFRLQIRNQTAYMIYVHTKDHRHFSLLPYDRLAILTHAPFSQCDYGYYDQKSNAIVSLKKQQHMHFKHNLTIACHQSPADPQPVCLFYGH